MSFAISSTGGLSTTTRATHATWAGVGGFGSLSGSTNRRASASWAGVRPSIKVNLWAGLRAFDTSCSPHDANDSAAMIAVVTATPRRANAVIGPPGERSRVLHLAAEHPQRLGVERDLDPTAAATRVRQHSVEPLLR